MTPRHNIRESWRKVLFALLLICLLQGSHAVRSPHVQAVQNQQQDRTVWLPMMRTAATQFNPAVDGFSFPNYTRTVDSSVTAVEMRRLFGDAVCGSTVASDGTCTLTPPAERWVNWANSTTQDGNCEGLAVVASLMHNGTLQPQDFGAESPSGLTIQNNIKLQREITFWAVTSLLNREATVKSSPNDVLAALRASITAKGTPFGTLRFVKSDGSGGHAVLPISVSAGAGSTVIISVYDSNYPGEIREILIDTAANTWFYSPDANLTEDDYTGNAQSQTLGFAPIEPRLAQQPCPFCTPPAAALQSAAISQSPSLATNGSVFTQQQTILPKQDNMFSAFDGAKGTTLATKYDPNRKPMDFSSLFPGVNHNVTQPASTPSWQIPSRGFYTGSFEITRTFDIRHPLDETDAITTSIVYLGPGYVFEIGQLYDFTGQVDTFEIAAGGKQVTYTTATGEVPELFVGFETAAADFGLFLDSFEMEAGDQVMMHIDSEHALVEVWIDTFSPTDDIIFSFAMERIDDTSVEVFESSEDGLVLANVQTLLIDYSSWNGNDQPLRMGYDDNENGMLDPEEVFAVEDAGDSFEEE